MPPAPWNGSATNAATLSAPSSRIFVFQLPRRLQAELLRAEVAFMGEPVRLIDVRDIGDACRPFRA